MHRVLVDTHTHVISDDLARYPLQPTALSGQWYRDAPVTAEELLALMDEAGVERAVLVQPMSAYTYDNSYAADSAASYPDRFSSACIVDVDDEGAPDRLEYWVRERGMDGVRLFTLTDAVATWLGEPRAAAVIQKAVDLDVSVSVMCLADQLPRLRRTLEQFPEVPITLDHCAFDVDAVLALSHLPNLRLKLTTTLFHLTKDREPPAIVDALADGFGAHRLVWGSDFSQTHDRPYPALVEFARSLFAGRGIL